MKKLHEFTEEEYNKLKASGFLWEFYPEATGEWGKDSYNGPITPPTLNDVLNSLCYEFTNTNYCNQFTNCADCIFNTKGNFLEWARGL